jgi:hypothetical protein
VAAFTALGVYPSFDETVKAMVHPTQFFEPVPLNSRKYALISADL